MPISHLTHDIFIGRHACPLRHDAPPDNSYGPGSVYVGAPGFSPSRQESPPALDETEDSSLQMKERAGSEKFVDPRVRDQ